MLTPEDTIVNTYVAPTGTPGDSEFPNATLAGSVEGDYIYYEQTGSDFLLLGIYIDTSETGTGEYAATHLSPTSKIFEIPTTYNTSFTDLSGFSTTYVDDSGSYDSIRSGFMTEDHVLVDGYGTLITPNGSFDALRERRISILNTTFEGYTMGAWTLIYSFTDTDTSYNWLGNNNLGLASVDILDGEILNISYSITGVQVVTPVANFSSSDLGDGTISFNDNSSNIPTSWLWDFGDGNTSVQQNPEHTYSTSGDYNVCLTATNSAGSNTTCMTVSVTVATAPVAAFTYVVEFNGFVDFTDASTNSPTSWLWDFGDGNTSTLQNPDHSYSTTGDYDVCLTATNSAGSNTTCMTVAVTIIMTPVAGFTFEIQSNGTVDFTDTSINDPTSWEWDFGDGNTSDMQNPQHTYSSSDNYNVCLTAINTSGSNMICESVDVIITGVDDFENAMNVEIFPNPVTDNLMLRLENTEEEVLAFRLINPLGQLVLNRNITSNGTYSFDVAKLATGMYYYTFLDENGVVRKRGSLMKN